MQEYKRKRPETAKDELLTEVLNACMEEQLSFIPPESEIARQHAFSEAFQEYMEKLLKTRGKPEQRQMTKREFVFRFNKLAACLLVLFVVGGLCAGGFLLSARMGSSSEKMAAAESPEASDMAELGTGDVMEEAAEEESPAEEIPEEAESTGADVPEKIMFMGTQIRLADSQYLPEATETVRTLVSTPLVDREAESVLITIGNMSESPIYYYKSMELEVQVDGAWYLLPSKQDLTEEELNHMVKLDSGMAQDEELFLEYYDLDFDAEKYRVVTYLDGLILSSEFRFENLETDLEHALDSTEE